ncbi:MAG: hypothetical protein WAK03_08685 [Methylocystis sp.]
MSLIIAIFPRPFHATPGRAADTAYAGTVAATTHVLDAAKCV